MDLSRGPEWATWFVGGRLNIAWNCVHRWTRGELAKEPALDLARRGRVARRADLRRAVARGDAPGGGARLARRRAGRPRGALPADVGRGSDRLARVRARGCGPGAGVLGVRRAGSRRAAAGRGGKGADHGGRIAAPRPGRADEGDRRRGGGRVTVAGGDDRVAPARRRGADDGRARPGVGRGGRGVARATCRRSTWTPSTPTYSPTRPGRPGGRRGSSTCTAASSSRSRARSPTRPTRARATASTSRPTWAGSWARGRWSAAARAAPRSCSPRARRTGRPTGSGGRSRTSASPSSAARRR